MPRDLVKEAAERAKSLQLEEIHSKALYEKRIKSAWDKFDVNGDGTISTKEFDNFLSKLNIRIPDSERARIFDVVDRNDNGTIEFVEFVKNYEKGVFNNL